MYQGSRSSSPSAKRSSLSSTARSIASNERLIWSKTKRPAIMRFRRGVVLVLICSLCPEVHSGAPGFAASFAAPHAQRRRAGVRRPARAAASERGLQLRLSDTGPSPAVAQQAANAASLLDEAESSKLLARLPAADTYQSELQEFRFSEQSPPPPRAGQQVLAAFPPSGPSPAEQPPAQPTSAEPAALEVVRYS